MSRALSPRPRVFVPASRRSKSKGWFPRLLSGVVIAGLCAALLWPVPSHAVSGNIPLDSGIYELLDILTARGFLRTYIAGTRPITYGEAYRLLEEARDHIERKGNEGNRSVPGNVTRAVKNLESHVLGSLEEGTGFILFKDPELDLLYLEGEPSFTPGIEASQHALVYNNEGIDPDEGGTGYLTFESELFLGDFNVQLFPLLGTGEEDRQIIHRGYVKTGLLGMELGAGKESLWWGQGRHGGLYLTSNAEPLVMVRLTNPHPKILPWIFKYLGPCRLDMFLSRLEEDRAVPEPYFGGVRLNFRPAYTLELGMSLMIMAGGEGVPSVDFGDLFDIIFGENEAGIDDRSNMIAGIDFRLNLPGWQVYGEYGGEDEAGGLPSKMAGLIGIFLPAVYETVDLRVEYADLAYTEEIAGAWYDHGIYKDGYTYKGRILGHHVGGDGRDLYTEVAFDLGERARGKVGIDLEWRGLRNMPVTEEHIQVVMGCEHRFGNVNRSWKGQITAVMDKVRNAEYVEGREETNSMVSLSLKRGF